MPAEAKPDSQELVNAKERLQMLIDKGKRIEVMDANELARSGRDINEIKARNKRDIADQQKEIQRLSK